MKRKAERQLTPVYVERPFTLWGVMIDKYNGVQFDLCARDWYDATDFDWPEKFKGAIRLIWRCCQRKTKKVYISQCIDASKGCLYIGGLSGTQCSICNYIGEPPPVEYSFR